MNVKIRRYKADDLNFIMSTYLNSYMRFARLPPDVMKCAYKDLFEKVLYNQKLELNVAVADDVIVGWVAMKPEFLLYVYVKEMFRGNDIGSELIKSLNTDAHVMFFNKNIKNLLAANDKNGVKFIL